MLQSRRLHSGSSSRSGHPCPQQHAWLSRRPPASCRVRCRSLPWDEATTISELQAQLDAAVKTEDYTAAARIRDALQQKSTDAKLGVEDANRRFYEAFMSGRIQDMAAVWGEGDHVQVVHPLAGCIAGREQVLDSWRTVLQGVRPRAFQIKLEDVRVFASESSGFVTCVEIIDTDDSGGRIAATNIFEKQGGRWVIIHHHGSPARPPR